MGQILLDGGKNVSTRSAKFNCKIKHNLSVFLNRIWKLERGMKEWCVLSKYWTSLVPNCPPRHRSIVCCPPLFAASSASGTTLFAPNFNSFNSFCRVFTENEISMGVGGTGTNQVSGVVLKKSSGGGEKVGKAGKKKWLWKDSSRQGNCNFHVAPFSR